MSESGKALCDLQDIPEGDSKGLYYGDLPLMLVRHGESVFAYHNQCPHLGLPLEWQQDQFLTKDKTLIQCATHGALFEINSGQCISGPCQGQYLRPFKVALKDGAIFAAEDPE